MFEKIIPPYFTPGIIHMLKMCHLTMKECANFCHRFLVTFWKSVDLLKFCMNLDK